MKVVKTEKLGDVPETEPRAALELDMSDEPVTAGAAQSERLKRIDEAFRHLRYRAHRYHGVTRMDPPAGKHDIDYAASELARAAMRFSHAYEPNAAKVDPEHPERGCACIFCV